MVGERLAELRVKKNMTQEEFAEYMGVTRQSVSKWEVNKAFPDVEKLIRISELYDVSIDYILKGITPKEEYINSAAVIEDNEKLTSNQEEISPESEGELDTQVDDTKKSKKRIGLLVSTIITALVATVTLVFLFCCIKQSSLDTDMSSKSGARVEKVYHQITLAEVGCYNENGDYVVEKTILDDTGLRQGDYIYVDMEGDDIKISYSVKTILVTSVFLLLYITILVLQIKELKYHE